ncbi:MAG: barstar family protein [Caldilineaceae bacterium]|nr:barstar family protein [Caldilineaceae bacterium]
MAAHPLAHSLADKLVQGDIAPGIYRIATAIRPAPLAAALRAQGWRVFVIDGKMIRDKASFLRAAGQALDFPAYAGHNWDAFEELVNDLSWAPARGYVILYEDAYHFAAAQPAAWQTARAVLQAAVAEWSEQQIPLVVLLRKSWYTNHDLPLIAEARIGATP